MTPTDPHTALTIWKFALQMKDEQPVLMPAGACGCAHWRRCVHCGQWDDPRNLYIPPRRGSIEHRRCGNTYRKAWQKIHKPWRRA